MCKMMITDKKKKQKNQKKDQNIIETDELNPSVGLISLWLMIQFSLRVT